MLNTDALLNAFATFFVTIDPPGMVAIFIGLTAGMSATERRHVAALGTTVALAIIIGFMLVGGALLSTLGISIAAFRVAGGLLLFYTAFEMVFEKREARKGETLERILSRQEIQSIAIFPLAIPFIAGPGSISAAILLAEDFATLPQRLALIGVLLAVGAILLGSFMLANQLNNLMGVTGRMILTRLLGILLAALAVQFVATGVLQLAS